MSRTPLGGPWVMTMSAPELMLKSWLSPRLYWNLQSASTDGVKGLAYAVRRAPLARLKWWVPSSIAGVFEF